jgi:purine-binding chemotaxis protein CheW
VTQAHTHPCGVTGQHQYLTFSLGQDTFAIDVMDVREVIEYGRVTDVPMMPAFIKGVINLRGVVIPVIDLSLRFGRAPSPIIKRTCIVMIECVAEEQKFVLGVIADSVQRVVDVLPTQVEACPAFGGNLRPAFIRAILTMNAQFVVVLALEHVLAVEEIMDMIGAAFNDGIATLDQMPLQGGEK